MVLKFENIWEPIKTRANVTSPKFNPFNLTVIGAIINPTIDAANPDKGSQIIISNSYPITLDVAIPPITAETYVPMPTKKPWAKLIWPAKPDTMFNPHEATAIKKAVVSSNNQ